MTLFDIGCMNKICYRLYLAAALWIYLVAVECIPCTICDASYKLMEKTVLYHVPHIKNYIDYWYQPAELGGKNRQTYGYLATFLKEPYVVI